MEKRIKTKQTELKELKAQLESVRKEVERAVEIARQTAFCCETSLDGLLNEVDHQIENTNDHLKKGLLELDIIEG